MRAHCAQHMQGEGPGSARGAEENAPRVFQVTLLPTLLPDRALGSGGLASAALQLLLHCTVASAVPMDCRSYRVCIAWITVDWYILPPQSRCTLCPLVPWTRTARVGDAGLPVSRQNPISCSSLVHAPMHVACAGLTHLPWVRSKRTQNRPNPLQAY
jgi:hypothetical protein